MHEIPSPLSTDVDDVVWALQTAKSLWERGDGREAVSWLRRAAQSASDHDHDARAIELARLAAELADDFAKGAPDAPTPTLQAADIDPEAPTLDREIPQLRVPPPPQPAPGTAPRPSATPAASSAKEYPTKERPGPRISGKPPARPHPPPPPKRTLREDPDVVTSAPTMEELERQRVVGRKGRAAPRAAAHVPEPAPSPPAPAAVAQAQPPPAHKRVVPPPPPPPPASRPPAAERTPCVGVDLATHDPFADMPAAAREAFCARAVTHRLPETQTVADFGLLLVADGAVHIAAVDSHRIASRVEARSYVRSTTSVGQASKIRALFADQPATIVTWREADVEEGLRSLPWVEEALVAGSDMHHARVGACAGALAEGLEPATWRALQDELQARVLMEGEQLLGAGEPVCELFVVGVGRLVVPAKGDSESETIAPGEVVFPQALRTSAAAPATVRAGAGGAIVLTADRATTEQLLARFGPVAQLLEVL